MSLRGFLLSTFVLVPGNPATACTPSIASSSLSNLLDFNQRVSSNPDCSFANAGKRDDLSGQPAVDLGRGFVSQIYVKDPAPEICPDPFDGRVEYLGLTNCQTGESVTIVGVDLTHQAYRSEDVLVIGSASTIERAIEVLGQIRLDPQGNFDALKALGAQRDVTIRSGLKTDDVVTPDWDTFEIACACKLYYSDSAGARQ